MREVMADLAEPDPMSRELLLWQDGSLSLFYAPWDWVNAAAKVMLVGITPGAFQATEALREARRCIREGLPNEQTLRSANAVGSFSGPMRVNLVAMLDGIGLHEALGIDSAARLSHLKEAQRLAKQHSERGIRQLYWRLKADPVRPNSAQRQAQMID